MGDGGSGNCEQCFSATLHISGLFVIAESDSVVVLGASATANSVCFRSLERHNPILQQMGCRALRLIRHLYVLNLAMDAEEKYAARQTSRAVQLEARGTSLRSRWKLIFRRYNVGAPWGHWEGQLDFARDILTLRKQGADFPLRVNRTGQ